MEGLAESTRDSRACAESEQTRSPDELVDLLVGMVLDLDIKSSSAAL